MGNDVGQNPESQGNPEELGDAELEAASGGVSAAGFEDPFWTKSVGGNAGSGGEGGAAVAPGS